MIIIGSRALNHHINLNRIPKDYDLISTYNEFDTFIKKLDNIIECYPINNAKKIIVKNRDNKNNVINIFEFEIAWENSSAKSLIELIPNEILNKEFYIKVDNVFDIPIKIPSLNVLYTIKMSHRYLKNSPHFLKTMRDIQLMKKNGAKIPDIFKEWFFKREKETYNYSHPNLNQLKSKFFDMNSGVNYIYDHDTIHIAMAHMCKPAYTFFKKDEKEVMCSKTKFFELPLLVQLYSVLEECYVLALERSQIPFKNQVHPKRSFEIALEKVCTSIASGWWREFAYDHYDEVMNLYDEKYVDKFWDAVDKGVVKLLQE